MVRALILLALVVMLLLNFPTFPAPAPIGSPEPPAPLVIQNPYSGEPMVTFDSKEKIVTITHMPIDVLICFGKVCKLQGDWK